MLQRAREGCAGAALPRPRIRLVLRAGVTHELAAQGDADIDARGELELFSQRFCAQRNGVARGASRSGCPLRADLERLRLPCSRLRMARRHQLQRPLSCDAGRFGGSGFNGTLPPALGALSQLRRLNLNLTQLSGSLDRALTAGSELRFLDLEETHIGGSLVSDFSAWSQLQHLDLGRTRISVTLYPAWSVLPSPLAEVPQELQALAVRPSRVHWLLSTAHVCTRALGPRD